VQLTLLARLKAWATALKQDVMALWLALRSPATPWAAKALAAIVVAYALSPIDLIPDFIPIIGYLDELILLPIGIALTIKLIPPTLMAVFRLQAASLFGKRPVSKFGAAIIVSLWVVALLGLGSWLWFQ
jgi:uncharacterized membrane protein YkvA (DUF1232 family)